MIHVLIADSTHFLCDSLYAALKEKEDIFVVGCATTAEEFRFLLPYADVVLLATEINGTCALKILEEQRLQNANTKFIVTGIRDEEETILRYIEAGAVGYILRQESKKRLIQKVRAVSEAKALVSPKIVAMLMERLAQLASSHSFASLAQRKVSKLNTLTSREYEILFLINAGYTNQEIACQLYIECGTVKNHVHNILKKLDANNRQEAASVYKMQNEMTREFPDHISPKGIFLDTLCPSNLQIIME